MNKSERLKQRHRAEKRFKFYGIASVTIAIIFVLILIQNIFSKGSSAFQKTVIKVDVFYDSELIELNNGATLKEIYDTDFYDLTIENLLKTYPSKNRDEEDELLKLFSSEAEYEIKNAFLNNNQLIDKTITLEITASDDIDQLHKGNYPRDLPEDRRSITDNQLFIYDYFVENEIINKNFNNYFFTNGDSRDPELAGIGGALVGSFYSIIICLLIAFPIAVLASIYLEEFAPKNKITDFIEININNLAAVPSIVYGLLALQVLLATLHLPRSTPLVAGITLALMTLPRIIIPCRASLKAVPPSIREGALAVGASKFQSVFHHVVPLALPGTLSGTIIGLAQALGETAPLILIGMVAFVVDIPSTPIDPSASLPVQVYLWSESAERGFVEKTSATIMILLSFLIMMNFIAVYLRQKFEKRWN
ncbi:MAG: phosphate ABC transporter permease [Pelagibacteraceae bacterium BACL5 MAG-121128-bin54]|jgi:phosphate transport system permease protein|nr:MAG: phosphate ABC transporter permease [Pelagibacteraceae bacterium BACL5 MAG-121015-bin10]KRO59783.1 MAG: phosphate ABC transporter permease [Pelagibacteraceae bacterium BACL5 MAG-121128-bin54]